jgi:DNA helicase TIP49 (TBP-interacting protein)
MSGFKKAEKKKSKLRLGISGPSGSGKTFSALRLAKGLGGRIAVIDTENGSASLYADQFDFDVIELSPPFLTSKFIDAIQLASKEKYDVIIVDSISHQWAGEGGLLREKEKLDTNPKSNSFANWAKMTPIHDKFVNAIIQCSTHIIVTMRSKEEYSQQRENDKTKIVRLGLAPIQRDGLVYELTTVLDIGMNHECETSKDRTGLFVDKTFKITEETGNMFIDWLNSGKELLVELLKDDETKSVDKPINDIVNRQALANISPVMNSEELNNLNSGEKYEAHIVKTKTVVNHAPKPITYDQVTFKGGNFKGKKFAEIEPDILDAYMAQCSYNAVNQKQTDEQLRFFEMYEEHKKNRGSK